MTAPDGGKGRPVLVIGGPPTTNGDLHVGHVAGPYVAADVWSRYQRALGRDVVFASGGDDSQTYVTTTAARLGTSPTELITKSWSQIKNTFEAMGIAVDGFAPTDDDYRSTVYDYVNRLHALGKFRLRTVRLPYSEATGTYLVEGLVGGDCPTCLADSRGGICEACGHWIDFDGLLDPWNLLDPSDEVTYREAEILVFPLEEYRERLIAFHEEKASTWRPHLVQLMRELLSKPLPDYPITYPVAWGLPAPFPETPGQTINAWTEGMPASMYCNHYGRLQQGHRPPTTDDAWRAEHDAELVFFVGFDNLFIWALVHVAELMAHEGRYVLPSTILTNEFYELENEKFSTSRNHLIRGADLVAEVPRDLVRFYLALTCPEDQRANFTREGLDKVTAQRLRDPWNALADRIEALVTDPGEELKVTDAGRRRAAVIVERFQACYDLTSFSLTRAADGIITQLARLLTTERAEPGDLLMEVRTFLACAAPILIDVTAEAEARGVELTLDTGAETIDAFLLPRLPGSVRSDRSTR
jgi:methionyl-tRNA synthetase